MEKGVDFHPGGDIHPLCLYGFGQPVGGRSKVKMFSSKICRNQNQVFCSLDIGQAQWQNIIGNIKEGKKEQTIGHNA